MARYIRQHRRARQTGRMVTIYDTRAPENVFDPDGGRYVVACDDHGYLVNTGTLGDAKATAARIATFVCDECQAEVFA